MLDFLENLRQKPVATRKKIVFIAATVITVVIFFVWLSIVAVRFKDLALDTTVEDVEERVSEEPLPTFEDIQEDLFRFMEEGRELIEQTGTLFDDSLDENTIQKTIDISENSKNNGIEIIQIKNDDTAPKIIIEGVE